jgi:hypothetical protein
MVPSSPYGPCITGNATSTVAKVRKMRTMLSSGDIATASATAVSHSGGRRSLSSSASAIQCPSVVIRTGSTS